MTYYINYNEDQPMTTIKNIDFGTESEVEYYFMLGLTDESKLKFYNYNELFSFTELQTQSTET